MSELTVDRLLEALRYSKTTGVFTWRISRPGRWSIKPGDIAGSPDRHGHILITIDGKRYAAHRLAFFYVNHRWPTGLVDHKDGIKSNNRFRNLRDANQFVNMQNLRQGMNRVNRSSKYLGVRRNKSAINPWSATIFTRGDFKHIGVFRTERAAHAAYIKAKRQLHAGCTI